jgi:uncharacterized membrane protein (UPF0127 family)
VRRPLSGLLALVLVGALLGFYIVTPPLTLLEPGEYETATVTIADDKGTELATVEVRIAETRDQRRIGLSRTDSLQNGTGMLFVHGSADSRSYHMRNMTIGLDIVFVDSDGTITEIHDAPVPAVGGTGPYRGRGQYVLEVPRGWTSATGVTVGDTVEIPEPLRS